MPTAIDLERVARVSGSAPGILPHATPGVLTLAKTTWVRLTAFRDDYGHCQ